MMLAALLSPLTLSMRFSFIVNVALFVKLLPWLIAMFLQITVSDSGIEILCLMYASAETEFGFEPVSHFESVVQIPSSVVVLT